jgi:hypothetical protein
MKPVFTAIVFLIFIAFSLIYIKAYGLDEFTRWIMSNAMGYILAFIAGGVVADILASRD